MLAVFVVGAELPDASAGVEHLVSAPVRRFQELEDENSRLKHLVSDLTLDNRALKELVRTDLKRDAARAAMTERG
jgi:hypothetical protein